MAKYICGVCGYEFSETKVTSFANLSLNWTCPVCGASKDKFNKA